jgi:preprotein translocase subunit SecE
MSANPPMNREMKRRLQKSGDITADGTPTRGVRTPTAPRQREERTSPAQFIREVRAEMRKVAWPTKAEVRNYSIIVLITVVIFTAFVALCDYLFGTGILWLYEP